jgi:hypothetical protein
MADVSEIRALTIKLEVLTSDNEGLEKRLRGAAEKIEGQQAAYAKVGGVPTEDHDAAWGCNVSGEGKSVPVCMRGPQSAPRHDTVTLCEQDKCSWAGVRGEGGLVTMGMKEGVWCHSPIAAGVHTS